jgi:hypothetical protein
MLRSFFFLIYSLLQGVISGNSKYLFLKYIQIEVRERKSLTYPQMEVICLCNRLPLKVSKRLMTFLF